jgi:hypothetical protein
VKRIKLTQGKYALIDDEDYDYLSQWKWYCHDDKRGNVYALRNSYINRQHINIKMHRVIMPVPKKLVVDHINGNGLDNRKQNLRIATKMQNSRNSNQPKNYRSSVFKGVTIHKRKNGTIGWRARIGVKYKVISLGVFETPEQAAETYNLAATKYYKQFARLNLNI